jgi:hypothetical protein
MRRFRRAAIAPSRRRLAARCALAETHIALEAWHPSRPPGPELSVERLKPLIAALIRDLRPSTHPPQLSPSSEHQSRATTRAIRMRRLLLTKAQSALLRAIDRQSGPDRAAPRSGAERWPALRLILGTHE